MVPNSLNNQLINRLSGELIERLKVLNKLTRKTAKPQHSYPINKFANILKEYLRKVVY